VEKHKNELDLAGVESRRKNIKKVFFYRICGTGMGNVALLLRECGYEVSGGDSTFYPPMSDYLRREKIQLIDLKELTAESLKKYDLIVVGNVVGKNSPCAQLIESSGALYTSFPAALGGLVLSQRNVIGVSGTHGKTTTSYFLKQMLESCGERPGYLVGGVIDGEQSVGMGTSQDFIIESDEYDSAYFHKRSKFHYYCIDNLIMTSLEFDHADIFANLDEIVKEFATLLQGPFESIIYNDQYQALKDLVAQRVAEASTAGSASSKTALFPYGNAQSNGPKILKVSDKECEFSLMIKGKSEKFATNVLGEQNVLNMSSAIFYLVHKGLPLEKIRESVRHLKMVKRRQEIVGKYRGAWVIDDFAHHPTAVKLTLEGIAQKFPGSVLNCVFAPASATARSQIFEKEFTESLKMCARVVLVRPPVDTTVKGSATINCVQMAQDLKNQFSVPATVATNLTEIIEQIEAILSQATKRGEGDQVIAILSNSQVYGLWDHAPFLSALKGS
jgi:UDP-N-acetylmuramate: L-alanyl-gamma-D-glutamyl-meso-diaminopimelate ligase